MHHFVHHVRLWPPSEATPMNIKPYDVTRGHQMHYIVPFNFSKPPSGEVCLCTRALKAVGPSQLAMGDTYLPQCPSDLNRRGARAPPPPMGDVYILLQHPLQYPWHRCTQCPLYSLQSSRSQWSMLLSSYSSRDEKTHTHHHVCHGDICHLLQHSRWSTL